MGEVGIYISKQVAHHCWHTGAHVFGGQTGEVPTEEREEAVILSSTRGGAVAIFGQHRDNFTSHQ